MAGGNDLNLLKSWNPKLSKNRAHVRKKEEELLQEEKKIQQHIKQRQIEDLAHTKTKTGLEWMYEDIDKTIQEKEKNPTKEAKSIDNTQTKNISKSDKTNIKRPSNIYYKDDPMSKFKVAKKKRNLSKK